MNVVSQRSSFQKGFTIVELLVVIVVIGILAAVTIVAFNGVSQRAVKASMQTDLTSASKQLKIDQISTGAYPSSTGAADEGKGLRASGTTTYQYSFNNSATPPTFCLTAINGSYSFYITQDGVPTEGMCPGHTTPNQGVVTTIPGGGTISSLMPTDVAIDSAGKLYITDAANRGVQTYVQGGSMTRILGNAGSSGVSNGTGAPGGAGATFTTPSAIVIAADGNIYLTDNGTNNNRVRKITPDIVVSSLAGNGTGYVEGTGTGATFSAPGGIAVGPDGTLYVSDSDNNRIRKITPLGVTSLFAGSTSGYTNAIGASAQFASPQGLAVDASGNVFVADRLNNRIRKITPDGTVSTFAGSTSGYADGTGTSALFKTPRAVTVGADGAIYVADYGNYRIRKIQ